MHVSLYFLLTCQCISWGNSGPCVFHPTRRARLCSLPAPGRFSESPPSCGPDSRSPCWGQLWPNGWSQLQGTAHSGRGGQWTLSLRKEYQSEKPWDVKTVRYEKHTHHIPASKEIELHETLLGKHSSFYSPVWNRFVSGRKRNFRRRNQFWGCLVKGITFSLS